MTSPTGFEAIAAIIDAAGPVPDAAELVAQSDNARASAPKKQRAPREAGRPIEPSPALASTPSLPPDPPPDPAAAAQPPAGAVSSAENTSSRSGGSSERSDADGERMGAKRARRARAARGDGGTPDGLDLKLAFLPHTDLGNAERFVARNKGKLLWCPALGRLHWDGRRWSRDGADEIWLRAAHGTVRAIQDEATALAQSEYEGVAKVVNEGKKNERELMMSDLLSGWGRDSESASRTSKIGEHAEPYLYVDPSALDADPFKINVNNGTLVIDRGVKGYVRFQDHDPADLITKLAPVDYDRKATCPAYDQFLIDVQPKPENVRFLHQWGGYSLTGDASEQALVFFWGKGKNGKSTLVDAWGFVAGDYGKSVPIETFVNEGRGRNAGQATPDLAMLHAVRYLRASEPERGAKLAEALIKLVTGGEPMSVRHLNRDYFMLQPVFKLTISGNYRPRIEGADEGIWRRVVLLPWIVTVSKEKMDRDLGRKLRLESSGMLNRLIDGLCDWLDHGLVRPDDVVAATADYRKDSDPLGRFLDACVIADKGGRVQASVFHSVFVAWARANSATEWSARGLAFAMKERGFESHHADRNWWMNVKLTRSANDFIDAQGHARVEGAPAEHDPRDDVPPDRTQGKGDDIAF